MIKSMKNKKKKGFTLVELIAVIAIIGILAAIIVPMIGRYTEKAKISKAVEEMRQYVMAVETASADTGVKINTTIEALTPTSLATQGATSDAGKLYVEADKIVDIESLTKIKGVSFANAKAGANGSATVTVNSSGEATVGAATTTN